MKSEGLLKTILLIDDHTPLRQNLCEMLEVEGYNTMAAPDGPSGLIIASEMRPDLIICDIMLPRMNGYEVFSQTRKDPATSKIPFIFMSADSEANTGKTKLGTDDFLLKPFDRKDLMEKVKRKLEQCDQPEGMANYTSLDHLQALENILNILSHEMRNPICSNLGLSGLLDFKIKQKKKPEEVEKIVEGIKKNAKKLDEITTALTVEIHAAIINYKTLMGPRA